MSEPERWWRIYRATFDTNIFLRTLIQERNLPNHLLSLWREGRFVLVLSQAIIDEIQDVLF
jgi:predicted nucleic acid-binding protein